MIDLTGKKVLYLTLSKAPFEVMVTGEKKHEFREDSKWIKSRLFDQKNGDAHKKYDLIKFTNGYGSECPYFIVPFISFWREYGAGEVFKYSNGLTVTVKPGDWIIQFGEILEIGNYELKQ